MKTNDSEKYYETAAKNVLRFSPTRFRHEANINQLLGLESSIAEKFAQFARSMLQTRAEQTFPTSSSNNRIHPCRRVFRNWLSGSPVLIILGYPSVSFRAIFERPDHG